MCSLEVPDIEDGIAAHYSDQDVVVLLANSGDSAGVIQTFLRNSGSSLPSLMDQTQSVHRAYEPSASAYAPFPVQVVIDADGVIRYLNYQYDAEAVRQTIDSLLVE